MYLFPTAWAFVAFAIIQPKHRKAWLILAACALSEGINAQVFATDWLPRQAVRGCIVFAAGYALCYIKSMFSLYQAVVLLVTLIAYAALALDVYGFRAPVLIANGYKGFIHGLVVAQFMGLFVALLGDCATAGAGGKTRIKNLRGYSQ